MKAPLHACAAATFAAMRALFRRGGDWMTCVLDLHTARQTKAEIAHHNALAAKVPSGLTTSQRMLVHPPDAVADGATVRANPLP